MTTGDQSIELERELERLLAKANLHRLRGQTIEAEDTCRQALKINPKDIVVREMLADVLRDAGKLDAALAEYKAALDYAPGKESLEKKFARTTLDIAEREREKAIALDMLENPHKYARRERSQGVALLCSGVPGLGQFYNGDYVKAGVVFGSFLLFVITYALLQRSYGAGVTDISSFLYFTNPVVQLTAVIFGLAYIYGVIDAVVTAGKTTKKPAPGQAEPPA